MQNMNKLNGQNSVIQDGDLFLYLENIASIQICLMPQMRVNFQRVFTHIENRQYFGLCQGFQINVDRVFIKLLFP